MYLFMYLPLYRAVLLIAKAVVGTGVGATKEEAKTAACTDAFNHLKKKYYTLRVCSYLIC